jgi:hypothetical protein
LNEQKGANSPHSRGLQGLSRELVGNRLPYRQCEHREGKAVRSFFTAMASAAVLSGCASNGDIIPAGPDTYSLTERFTIDHGGAIEAKKDALIKVNEFCETKGRKFVPNTMGQAVIGHTEYTVTFRCLLPNDPEVAKYQLEQGPNVTGH